MIYLDNAATSWPKPPAVLQAVQDMLVNGGNAGRGSHSLALRSAEIVFECRENLAALFNIENPLRICFTSNATESLNLALKGWLKPGDHVVCSGMEHNSVWRPLTRLQSEGVEFSIALADAEGRVSAESVLRELRPNTRMVAVLHASNVNGAINPIGEIGELTSRLRIPFLVDASQTAGCVPIDVEAMHIDLLAFPGHKGLLGPQGTGGLYVRQTCELTPLKEGGTGSDSKSPLQPEYVPDRYESGTLNTLGIAGLSAGVSFLRNEGVEKIREREQLLTDVLIRGLQEIPGVRVYAPQRAEHRTAVISFAMEDRDPVTVAHDLEERFGIACRAGLHCACLAHRSLGTEDTGTVRFSLGVFSTQTDVDAAIEAVRVLAQEPVATKKEDCRLHGNVRRDSYRRRM